MGLAGMPQGRTVLQLAVDDWTLDKLMVFDADVAELEDADDEPEPEEVDGAPISGPLP